MRIRQTFTALGLAALAFALSACREDEQNRPLAYEKGVYQGAEDEQLTEEDRRVLQQRGSLQGF